MRMGYLSVGPALSIDDYVSHVPGFPGFGWKGLGISFSGKDGLSCSKLQNKCPKNLAGNR